MSRSLNEKVDEAFDDKDVEDAQKFLDLALSSLNQASDSISRTVLLMLLLAAVFELLINSSAIKDLTVGPITFNNTTLLQQFIPVVVAYLFYDTFRLTGQVFDNRKVYKAVIQKFQPKLADSGLVDLALPKVRGPLSRERPIRGYPRRGDMLNDFFTSIIGMSAGFLLPILFELHAYYRLIQVYGSQNKLVLASMAASSFLILGWLVRLITSTEGD
jgi:hypothetical protein